MIAVFPVFDIYIKHIISRSASLKIISSADIHPIRDLSYQAKGSKFPLCKGATCGSGKAQSFTPAPVFLKACTFDVLIDVVIINSLCEQI